MNAHTFDWLLLLTLIKSRCFMKVKITGHPALIVKENESLTLDCSANSYPSVSFFTWMKMIDGTTETTISTGTPFIVDSASVSDSGKYRCTAENEIGTGKSVQVEVKSLFLTNNRVSTRLILCFVIIYSFHLHFKYDMDSNKWLILLVLVFHSGISKIKVKGLIHIKDFTLKYALGKILSPGKFLATRLKTLKVVIPLIMF
uniref:Ig-like domain-containing protein n=1 Tax=Neolamprologus brichardi TaxID=32507 RepID=A0A3Q4GXS3_NEOBR